MSEHKGQALGYIVLALGGWTIMRILVLYEAYSSNDPTLHYAKTGYVLQRQKSHRPFHSASLSRARNANAAATIPLTGQVIPLRVPDIPIGQFAPRQAARIKQFRLLEPQSAKSALSGKSVKPSFLLSSEPFAFPHMLTNEIGGPLISVRNQVKRARFYAYSFWRQDGSVNFLNNPSQFGASQSGFIGEIPLQLFGKSSGELALIFRGHLVPTDRLANEIGAGMRWKPLPVVPVHFAIEARRRASGGKRILVYAVIAPNPIKLSPKLTAHAYAQLGLSSGQEVTRFLDANARVEMPVWENAKAKIAIGPLVSASIQSGGHRVEFGPMVSADLAMGETRFRLSADWRSQISGDVARRSGPAITVSMSF
jgi:hypothetical protein